MQLTYLGFVQTTQSNGRGGGPELRLLKHELSISAELLTDRQPASQAG